MTLTAEDLQRATQAKSDQLNSCDILGGSLVVKIIDVKSGSSEQPVIIVIDSWPQPWKPSKTSLRVLCACWGNDPQQWIGRYAVLFCDETVKFGGEAIGGIRTSHLSHISGTKKVAVNTTRGKKGIQTVEPYYPQEASAPVNAEPIFWPDDAFAKRLAAAQPKIDSGELTVEAFIATLEKKAPMTAGQKARVKPTLVSIVEDDEPPQYDSDNVFDDDIPS
jgi:hypothetical protein